MTSANKTLHLDTQSLPRLILSYFLASLAGLIFNAVYNLTDTLFISRGVGDVAMGGVAVIMPIVMLQGGISTMIGGGAATLVATKLGEGKPLDAGKITLNAMLAFYTVAIVITIVGLVFYHQILSLLGAVGEIYEYAKSYYIIILAGNVFSTGFSSIIRAEGSNGYATLIWVVPISINIVLDAVFIFVLEWGVKGAALATVISQVISFMFSIVFFTKFSLQRFRGVKCSYAIIVDICKIGLPVLAQVSAFSIMTMLINAIISNRYGDDYLIAFGYISKILYYAIIPFLALSQALSPIISYNNASSNDARVKKATIIGVVIAVVYAIVAIIIIGCLPAYLIAIFTDDVTIISLAKSGVRILSVSLIFMVAPIILGTIVQAKKRTFLATIAHLSGSVLAIPCVILLASVLDIDGVWAGYTIGYAVATIMIISTVIFKNLLHKRNTTSIC